MAQNAPLEVVRLPLRLTCNAERTITRFFWPGGEDRARRIIDRVHRMDAEEAATLLAQTVGEFRLDHPNLDGVLTEHYEEAARRAGINDALDKDQRLLIGAYFTMEYAFESAALFNPSMVRSYDQEGVPEGRRSEGRSANPEDHDVLEPLPERICEILNRPGRLLGFWEIKETHLTGGPASLDLLMGRPESLRQDIVQLPGAYAALSQSGAHHVRVVQ